MHVIRAHHKEYLSPFPHNIYMFSSAPGVGSPGERKISFAVNAERSDSIHSSTTSISIDPMNPPHTPVEERKGNTLGEHAHLIYRFFLSC